MVIAHDELRARGAAVDERAERKVTAQQVVEPGAGDELFVDADHGREVVDQVHLRDERIEDVVAHDAVIGVLVQGFIDGVEA